MTHIIQPALSIALLSFLLGGCSTFSPSDTQCMKTVLITSASRMPLSRVMTGDGRDVIITGFKGGCGGSSAQLPGGSDDIGIILTLTTPEARHSTGKVKEVTLPLFVALLDKEENVKDRHDENVKVTISDRSLNHTHKITYHPPEGIEVDDQSYRVLVGFNTEVGHVLPSKYEDIPKAKKTPLKKVRKKKTKQKGA